MQNNPFALSGWPGFNNPYHGDFLASQKMWNSQLTQVRLDAINRMNLASQGNYVKSPQYMIDALYPVKKPIEINTIEDAHKEAMSEAIYKADPRTPERQRVYASEYHRLCKMAGVGIYSKEWRNEYRKAGY